jgi:hypothetical protein
MTLSHFAGSLVFHFMALSLFYTIWRLELYSDSEKKNLKVFGRMRSWHNQSIIPELAKTEEKTDKSQWGAKMWPTTSWELAQKPACCIMRLEWEMIMDFVEERLDRRCRWPCSLRRKSEAAWLLGLRDQILLSQWIFICCAYCVLYK